MAYLNKEERRIELTVEEQENFKKASLILSRPEKERRSETVENIMSWVMTGKRNDNN